MMEPDEDDYPEGTITENWEAECDVCGATPTVGALDLCGPCCFGEADTIGGNW